MNNLKLLKHSQHKFDCLEKISSFSIDDVSGNIAIGTNFDVSVIDQNGALLDHKYATSSQSETIKYVHVISSPLICVTTDKSMTTWNSLDGTIHDFIELEESILTVEWSPDFSIGVVITKDLKITLISNALEQLAESNLQQEGFGTAEFVTVGWGKKETQFHGSIGKQAAQQTKQDITNLSEWDNGSTLISWRPDGDFFAVSWVVADPTPYRHVRIFNSEAILHSTSELIAGLEQGLCWNPKRSLLAASQRHPRGLDIIFFETNGLRHGEFQLFPSAVKSTEKNEAMLSSHVKVRDLSFNREGDILAVSFVTIGSDENNTFLRLYTSSNYHWYVKQQLNLDQLSFKWCPIDSHRLHLLHSDCHYLSIWWTNTVHRSEIIHSSTDPSLVAVIDAMSVHFTPFRGMVIPPPMSAYSVQFSSPVNFLCLPAAGVHVSEESDWICACLVVLANHSAYLITYLADSTSSDIAENVKVTLGTACGGGGGDFKVTCTLPSSVTKLDVCFDCDLNHGLWLSPDLICVTTGGSIFLMQQDKGRWKLKKCYEMQAKVISICKGAVNERLYVQTEYGDVWVCSIDSMLLSEECVQLDISNHCPIQPSVNNDETSASALSYQFRFPQVCSQMYCIQIESEDLVIGLCTSSHQLYAKTKSVMSLCSSIALHKDFLIVTSMLQTISSIPLDVKLFEFYQCFDDQADRNVGTYENKIRYDEKIRAIEPGAFIVTVVSMDTKVILQLPRGNLETIYPRSLVLSYLRKLIDNCDYSLSVDLMKRHRINFNLIYDHNPELFLVNIDKFVTDVNNPTILNIFLVDIVAEDLTQTMYSKFYKKSLITAQNLNDPIHQLPKADRIAESMIKCLENLDQQRYLFCILTCYAKKSKPQLDQALIRMRRYKDNGDMSMWESCLQHLKYLCDVVQLYHISLATYDLELAASVAQYTQLDPKEYIPFLNELRLLPESIRQYRIDLLLKYYRSALIHIVAAGAEYFDDCLQLVNNHKLFSEALQLYPHNSTEFQTISECFANHLIKEERSLSAAGSVYLRAGLYKQAADCFYRANQSSQWLIVAAHLDPEERKTKSQELAVRLVDLNRFSEAVTIYEDYLQDHKEAVGIAAQGALWDTALRLCHLHELTDLIESVILPELNRCSNDFIDRLANHKSEFINHRQRLLILRQKHHEDYVNKLFQRDYFDEKDESEIFSDTSSMSGSSAVTSSSNYTSKSSMSKLSGRSSRTKRKAERKKWTMKEGSALEEVALMEDLYKNITVGQSFVDECRSLVDTQITIGSSSVARNLIDAMNCMLSAHTDSLSIIWDGLTWPVRLTNSVTAFDSMTSMIVNLDSKTVDDNRGRKVYDILEDFLFFPPKIVTKSIKHPAA